MRAIRRRAAARRAVTALLTGMLAAAGTAAGASEAAAGELTARPLTAAEPALTAGEPVEGRLAGGEAVSRPEGAGGASATLGKLKAHGRAVITDGSATTETAAGLFEMSVSGGGSLLTYGIDMYSSTAQGARYEEVPWADTSLHDNPEAGHIRWILRHSYPQVDDLAALADRAGASQLTPQTAAAGTQVAIWRYSDLGPDGGRPDVTAVDPNAEKLADYLVKEAEARPEPGPSLALRSRAAAGRPGAALGPVTVQTGADHVSVAPGPEAVRHGVRIVDARGEEVTQARDGTELWFDVPEDAPDASASLTVQGTTQIPVGRTLADSGVHSAGQAQVVAGSSDATVTARATASWAAEGAAPAVSARPDCVAGALAVTVDNRGDAAFTFTLGEEEHAVPGGTAETVAVPVGEDQAYRITIAGAQADTWTFSGVLNCATLSAEPQEEGLSVHSEPVTVGGDSSGQHGVNLAETGSDGQLPLLTAVGLGLLVLGGGALVTVGRNRP